MNKDYYADYYTMEREHWWFLVRGKIILDQIRKLSHSSNQPLKILNVGIATGATSILLGEFGEVTSVEYDKECCEFVREKLKIPVIEASVLALPFEAESFDIVCAFDVIEHVEDDQKACEELKRVCKSGGKVVVTVPAYMQLWSQHDVVNQHHRRYVASQLKALFRPEAQIMYWSYFNTFLFPMIWSFRQLSRLMPKGWRRKGAGSDFSVVNSKSFINRIFYFLFNTERSFLKFIRFPFGVSIILIWQKIKTL